MMEKLVWILMVTLLAGEVLGKYCVIDLAGGAAAAEYPVSYVQEMPQTGWSDEFKTTKLVLREIPAGVFLTGEVTSRSRCAKIYPAIFYNNQPRSIK